jgi:hypothetical protein
MKLVHTTALSTAIALVMTTACGHHKSRTIEGTDTDQPKPSSPQQSKQPTQDQKTSPNEPTSEPESAPQATSATPEVSPAATPADPWSDAQFPKGNDCGPINNGAIELSSVGAKVCHDGLWQELNEQFAFSETALVERNERHPQCGVESYLSASAPLCGIATYKTLSSPACPAIIERQSQFGIESTGVGRGEVCGAEHFETRTDAVCGVDNVVAWSSWGTWSCPAGSSSVETEWRVRWTSPAEPRQKCERKVPRTCEHPSFPVIQWKECAHPNFGVTYNPGVVGYQACAHPSHGPETFQTCEHPSFGVRTHKSCAFTKNLSETSPYLKTVTKEIEVQKTALFNSSFWFFIAAKNKAGSACTIEKAESANLVEFTRAWKETLTSIATRRATNALQYDCEAEFKKLTSYECPKSEPEKDRNCHAWRRFQNANTNLAKIAQNLKRLEEDASTFDFPKEVKMDIVFKTRIIRDLVELR